MPLSLSVNASMSYHLTDHTRFCVFYRTRIPCRGPGGLRTRQSRRFSEVKSHKWSLKGSRNSPPLLCEGPVPWYNLQASKCTHKQDPATPDIHFPLWKRPEVVRCRWAEYASNSRVVKGECTGRHASMDGLVALDYAGAAGLGNAAFLHWGSPREGQWESGTVQQRALQDPGQAGKAETAEWRSETHGRDSKVGECFLIIQFSLGFVLKCELFGLQV